MARETFIQQLARGITPRANQPFNVQMPQEEDERRLQPVPPNQLQPIQRGQVEQQPPNMLQPAQEQVNPFTAPINPFTEPMRQRPRDISVEAAQARLQRPAAREYGQGLVDSRAEARQPWYLRAEPAANQFLSELVSQGQRPVGEMLPDAIEGAPEAMSAIGELSVAAGLRAPTTTQQPATPQSLNQPTGSGEAAPTATLPPGMDMNQAAIDRSMQQGPAPTAPQTQAAPQIPQAPQTGLTTVGGAPLQEFLSGAAMPERGMPRAERQLAGRGETLSPAEWEQRSQELQNRIGQESEFTQTQPSQNVPQDVREAAMTPAGRRTQDQKQRLAQWESSTQGKEMGGVRGLAGTEAMTAQDQVNLQRSLAGLQLDEMKIAQMQQNLQELPQEKQQKFNKDISALQQVMADTQRINEIGTRAGQSTGFGKTGVSGWLMNLVPGSGSRDFRGDIGTLQADSAFSALKAMKEASPNGGALGQVTERELELLYQAQVALDPNLSEDRIKSNVRRYLDIRNDVMKKAYQGFAREYGKEVADQIMSGGGGQPQSQGQPAQGGKISVPNVEGVTITRID